MLVMTEIHVDTTIAFASNSFVDRPTLCILQADFNKTTTCNTRFRLSLPINLSKDEPRFLQRSLRRSLSGSMQVISSQLLPGGFRFAHLTLLSKHIGTFGTDSHRLHAGRSEHSHVPFGDERATIQTFRHDVVTRFPILHSIGESTATSGRVPVVVGRCTVGRSSQLALCNIRQPYVVQSVT